MNRREQQHKDSEQMVAMAIIMLGLIIAITSIVLTWVK